MAKIIINTTLSKSEAFDRILALVVEVTEVTPERIFSPSRHAEDVDARHLLVFFLWRGGFREAEIARRTHLTPQGVSRIICGMDARLEHGSPFLRVMAQRIDNKL